jgi:regulator of protease activity HflC (stomatin/prohibitin superfamily)
MKEIVLNKKKNGFLVLILSILAYVFAAFLCVLGAATTPWLTVIGGLWLALGWMPWLGLKVIKPQEALVLTLFGKYIGTRKEEGFY